MANDLTVNVQALTKPCLPELLERLIEMGTEHRREGNGSEFQSPSDAQHELRIATYRKTGEWSPEWGEKPVVPRLRPETVDMVIEALRQYDLYLAPADRAETSARIAALLAHYFVPDMPAGLQTVIMTDWLDELAEFPAWAIQEACRGWLRNEKRKPTLADIIRVCNRATYDSKTEVRVLERALEHQGPMPSEVDEDRAAEPNTIIGAG